MNQFLKFVLGELLRGLVLMLPLAGGVGVILFFCYRRHQRRHPGKFPWDRVLLWLAFGAYLLLVLYATLLRGGAGYRNWNLRLFLGWREAWNNFSVKSWANLLLNIALFLPLGLLLPRLCRWFRKWYRAIFAGFLLSLTVELLQLGLSMGTFDVDDLFANTLGAVLGCCLWGVGGALARQEWKRVWVPGGVFLTICAAIGGIFVTYALQEFGNLPYGPVSAVDTAHIHWVLECDLSDRTEAAVYGTRNRTKADCDAFAGEFREIVGAEFDDVSYYEDSAYYMDHSINENGSHILIVDYRGSYYEYSRRTEADPVWAGEDREAITAALAGYPVTIPEGAEYSLEDDGWHTFWAEQMVTEDGMYDGTLRCRCAADGTVYNIDNLLILGEFYKTVAILTPQEAYEALQSGDFSNRGNRSELPAEVRITDVKLGYEVDTKGFYQPVYYFTLTGGDFAGDAMVPALK